jgi:hypothetical protein
LRLIAPDCAKLPQSEQVMARAEEKAKKMRKMLTAPNYTYAPRDEFYPLQVTLSAAECR